MPFQLKDARKTMDTSSNILAFATQILAFVGFLATCITVIKYLNPIPSYTVLADSVSQVRQLWIVYEGQGIELDDCMALLLSTLERLEDDVRDLFFVLNTKSLGCQARAWTRTFRIKKLSKRAHLLRIVLPHIVQMNKEIHGARRNSVLTTPDLVLLEKSYRSREDLMGLIAETNLQIPPVPWSPSLENLPLCHVNTTGSSSEDSHTLCEPISSSKTWASQAEELEAGDLSKTKKRRLRSVLKRIFSVARSKRRSCEPCLV